MTESKCINDSNIDPKTNLCMGCDRSIKKISDWTNMNEKKKNLLLKLKYRVNKK